MPESTLFKRLLCCANPSETTTQTSELESEVLELRAKLAAAEEEKRKMAEEQRNMAEQLSDATEKQNLLAKTIVKVQGQKRSQIRAREP